MKLKTVITATSLILFLAPIASAAEFQMDQKSLSKYKEAANQHSDQLPDFVKDLIGNQNINIYIERNQSESYNLSLQMKGTKVDSIDNQSLENPEIEVWTSTKIIKKVSESDEPVKIMSDAINKNEIEYQANDTWTKVKVIFIETFMKLV